MMKSTSQPNQNKQKSASVQISELMAAKDAAEKANRFKTQFLATVSHELRTPLHVVLGTLEILSQHQQVQNNAELRLPVDMLIRNSDRLLKLVNNLLDLSRIEQGKLTVNYESFDLSVILEGIPEMMDTLLRDKPVTFQIENHAQGVHVLSDKQKVTQILINLLGNAAKFTMEGRVTLTVALNDQDHSRLMFQVEDTGEGISLPDQEHLFDAYFKAGNDQNPDHLGTGLGLSITKVYVEKLGGTIGFQSVPGQGSTFIVSLPVQANVTLPVAPKASEERVSGASDARVLVCDDDVFSLSFLKMTLAETVNCECVNRGLDVVNLIQADAFDVVLLDIEMPAMNGYEVLQRIRALGYSGPVIALTAHAMDEEQSHILGAGFDACLAKPFSRQDVLTLLDRILLK